MSCIIFFYNELYEEVKFLCVLSHHLTYFVFILCIISVIWLTRNKNNPKIPICTLIQDSISQKVYHWPRIISIPVWFKLPPSPYTHQSLTCINRRVSSRPLLLTNQERVLENLLEFFKRIWKKSFMLVFYVTSSIEE